MSPYNSIQNNPISYSDPEGEWIHIAIGAVIGGMINTATHWDVILRDGLWAGLKAINVTRSSSWNQKADKTVNFIRVKQ